MNTQLFYTYITSKTLPNCHSTQLKNMKISTSTVVIQD